MLVGIKKNISSLEARRDRIANTAQIDDSYLPNLTIERNVCVPYDDQVCLAASQPLLQFTIAVPVLHTGSVVSTWRSMDTE